MNFSDHLEIKLSSLNILKLLILRYLGVFQYEWYNNNKNEDYSINDWLSGIKRDGILIIVCIRRCGRALIY